MDKDIAKEFCDECEDTFKNWVVCRIVFQDLPSHTELSVAEVLETPIGQCIERVYRMCHEAWISQVDRLSAPSMQFGKQNLSIDLLCEADGWSADELAKIDRLRERLKQLPEHLKPARNQIIAHNNLPTRLDNTQLGYFPEGMDEDYFSALAELATMVWEKWYAAHASPLERNKSFEFSLTALEDDASLSICQAKKLGACLVEGLQNSD